MLRLMIERLIFSNILLLANALSDLGNYEEAVHDYTKAIDKNPHDAFTYFNRGLYFEIICKDLHWMNWEDMKRPLRTILRRLS